jgi:hypothetical protein
LVAVRVNIPQPAPRPALALPSHSARFHDRLPRLLDRLVHPRDVVLGEGVLVSTVFDVGDPRDNAPDVAYRLVGTRRPNNCITTPLEKVLPAEPGDFSTGTILPDDTEHGR